MTDDKTIVPVSVGTGWSEGKPVVALLALSGATLMRPRTARAVATALMLFADEIDMARTGGGAVESAFSEGR